MESYSLYQLNEYIRQVVALNFEEAIWIECEISSIKSSRGSYYLDLTQKDEDSDEIIANANAVIWYKTYLFISKKLGELSQDILSDGTEVKLKARVDFNEKYGLKLVIEDIDPSYTLGKHELAKQKIYQRLKSENLIEINSNLSLAPVIQRIAIISSEEAAGYKDFIAQLDENNYGYSFNYALYPSAVQGLKVESMVVNNLKAINEKHEDFDCAIIIRGGGSKLDLSAFDNYAIAKQISEMQIPLIIGIGHEIDQTITDLVSHSSLKTPTAVANFLIERNLEFESGLQYLWQSISRISRQNVSTIKSELAANQMFLVNQAKNIIREKNIELPSKREELNRLSLAALKTRAMQLDYSEKLISSISPDRILKKGFAIIRQSESIVTRKKGLKMKESVEIEFFDGKVKIEK